MTDSPEIAALKSALENVRKAQRSLPGLSVRSPRQRALSLGMKGLAADLAALIDRLGRQP